MKNKKNKKEMLHVCKDHTGKMHDLWSLSTSPLVNEGCLMRRLIEGSVCQKCYSCAMCKRYKYLSPCYERNGEILSSREIDVANDLPYIGNLRFFRFESFGDLINAQHLKNYIKIAKAYPATKFALWTKAIEIGNEVFIKEKVKCPRNLTILVSSLFIDKQIARPSWAHKVFTVYNKETAEERGININCGARNCATCNRCYRRGGDEFVNELLK